MANQITVYINSSAPNDDGAGIHVFKLDMETGALKPQSKVTAMPSCSYFNPHPSGRYMLATGPREDAKVVSFAIDAESGDLTLLSSQPADAHQGCYVSFDSTGQYALVVSYDSPQDQGSAYVFPFSEDGKLGPRSDYRQYEGKGPVPKRQSVSHPHMITQEPAGGHVIVSDLGSDRLWLHRLNAGKFEDAGYINVDAGSGPRHMAFKPPYLYLINELGNTIKAFVYEEATQSYIAFQTVPTLPEDALGIVNTTADINIHPSGRFLYGSNRGHNSLVSYRIGVDGWLSYIEHTSSGGNWPRAFHIEASGRLLLSANQYSDDVFTFWVDAETGVLTPTGHSVKISGGPSCIRSL